MKISVELSLYPLQEGYKNPIKSFIKALQQCEGLEVSPNRMSTQVFGEYDLVMESIQSCLKDVFEKEGVFVLNSKILNTDRS